MSNVIQNISLEKIVKNRFQPEGMRDAAKVLEIASSLMQNKDNGTKGLLQVPTARATKDGMYELAFGHHRLYAFELNAASDPFFSEMPVIVRELTDVEMFELMAIENFQRRDISPMEEANTLHSYMTTFKKTSVEAAQKFEKSDEYVRGAIRLLNLPEAAKQMLQTGTLNKSQARNMLVAEKLGGAELVQEILDEITSNPDDASTGEIIVDVLRGTQKTTFLDNSADWFTSKKFPVKYLVPLKQKELVDILHFEESWIKDQPKDVPVTILKDILTLIAAGMEVTDDAFPMIVPDDLERVRVLANPSQCEKCPLHAVLDSIHFCGLPLCKARKLEAWKMKELDDQVKKIGVPMYQKSDGPYAELHWREDADQKLWKEGSADLRLVPAQYMWNNFEGVSQNLKVVLIGKGVEERLKKQESAAKKEQTQRINEQIERAHRDIKLEFANRFIWHVVSLAFECVLDGVTSLEFLVFHYEDMNFDQNNFPEDIEENKLLNEAQKGKKADGLKMMRRMTIYHVLDKKISTTLGYGEVIDAKKTILKMAEEYKKIAVEWGVKLPKDFSERAEEYQVELDAAIKEAGK